MAEITPQMSEVLEKALALSTQERGLVIDRLIASLDEAPAEDGCRRGLGRRRSSGGSMIFSLGKRK